MVPLVTERLACNVIMLYNSIANVLVESRYTARKLQRNARDELACMTHISTAAGEEEAGSEALLVEVVAGGSARNGRLPSAG